MSSEQLQLLIADASALLNFLSIRRLDLLTGLPYKLLITDVVRYEVQKGVLTAEEADVIKEEWSRNYRFTLKIASFRLLIE